MDSRVANKIMVFYRFAILRLDNLLYQLSEAIVFSKLDLKSGYHHIRICPKDECKKAFKIWEVLYECSNYFHVLDELDAMTFHQ